MKTGIWILNYNGRALLEKYLPSFEKAVARSRHECVLGVVDNKSSDDSVAYLKKNFPRVAVFEAPENKVLCSYNDLAKSVTDQDVMIFMNNDIRVDENFIDPMLKPFTEAKDVFFVTPRCLALSDGAYEGSKTRAEIRYGIFSSTSMYPGHERDVLRRGLTFQGGFGAFDRHKFVELGGYDELYLPGRLEDADVCFRAYKRGWRCFYEPDSVVYHEGGVSFKKSFGIKKTLVINWRNTFLFMWKNLSDRTNFLVLPFWLPVRLLYALMKGQWELPAGFFQALARFGKARARRRAVKKAGMWGSVPDEVIFETSTASF